MKNRRLPRPKINIALSVLGQKEYWEYLVPGTQYNAQTKPSFAPKNKFKSRKNVRNKKKTFPNQNICIWMHCGYCDPPHLWSTSIELRKRGMSWGINSLATSPNSSKLLDSCNKSWSISRIDRGLLLWWWHDSPKIHKRGYKRRQKRATNHKCPDFEKESCDEWWLQKHGIRRELWGRKRIGFQACLFLPLLGQKKRQGATGEGILNANQAIMRIQGTNSKLGSGGKEQQNICLKPPVAPARKITQKLNLCPSHHYWDALRKTP